MNQLPSDDHSKSSASESVPSTPVPGPQPAPNVVAELTEFLDSDPTRLGEVYRGGVAGLDARGIADSLGVSTSSFVWNYQQIVAALLTGALPSSPSMALTADRKFRKLLSQTWSTDTTHFLERMQKQLERVADDEAARVEEDEAARIATVAVENEDPSGIYVYSLPHYIRYPWDPDSGRTLLKVGHSRRDAIERFRQQTRTTALPEEPVLLRVYSTTSQDSEKTERNFHSLLDAADHSRSATRAAGKEWFLTTLRFLDEIARILELGMREVNSGAESV
ncbi:GIY-YIG nuclease family protein [Rhodococcus erythropolis]|nr:GIY-YIG nuclease family protein [Rhodococcus erythropolis]